MIVFSGIAAVAAAFSALGAYLAARAARKAAQGQLLLALLNDYAAPDMSDALRKLVDWRRSHGDSFATVWKTALRDRVEPFASDIDRARRRVSCYYQSAGVLHERGHISRAVWETAVNNTGLTVFFQVVEPLEIQLNREAELAFAGELRAAFPDRVAAQLFHP